MRSLTVEGIPFVLAVKSCDIELIVSDSFLS